MLRILPDALTIIKWYCLPRLICWQPLRLWLCERFNSATTVAAKFWSNWCSLTSFLSGLKRILNFNIFHHRMIGITILLRKKLVEHRFSSAMASALLQWSYLERCTNITFDGQMVPSAEVVKALQSLVTSVKGPKWPGNQSGQGPKWM